MLDEEIAFLARQHNDANIISIPARFTSIPAVEMVETFKSRIWWKTSKQSR
jgi:ribose 5-phosphate isomerase B